jgi:hypothetical protein
MAMPAVRRPGAADDQFLDRRDYGMFAQREAPQYYPDVNMLSRFIHNRADAVRPRPREGLQTAY